jgi:hypothetical protein
MDVFDALLPFVYLEIVRDVDIEQLLMRVRVHFQGTRMKRQMNQCEIGEIFLKATNPTDDECRARSHR